MGGFPDLKEERPVRVTKTAPKNEAVKAALLSALVIPGAGQCYNRQWGKGLFIAVVFTVATLAALIPLAYAAVQYLAQFAGGAAGGQPQPYLAMLAGKLPALATLVGASLLLYVYSIVDAYRGRR